MISVVATLVVQDGKAEETIEAFKEIMPKIKEEKGTLFYSVNRDKKDPNTIVVMERYADNDALNEHSSTPYFKEFSKKLGSVLAAKPDIKVLDEIDAIVK